MGKQAISVFKALSDETRIDIIRHLLGKQEIACKKLLNCFSLSQPALSHHFNKLIDAQILKVRKVGASHFYAIDFQYLKSLGIDIETLVNKSL